MQTTTETTAKEVVALQEKPKKERNRKWVTGKGWVKTGPEANKLTRDGPADKPPPKVANCQVRCASARLAFIVDLATFATHAVIAVYCFCLLVDCLWVAFV